MYANNRTLQAVVAACVVAVSISAAISLRYKVAAVSAPTDSKVYLIDTWTGCADVFRGDAMPPLNTCRQPPKAAPFNSSNPNP